MAMIQESEISQNKRKSKDIKPLTWIVNWDLEESCLKKVSEQDDIEIWKTVLFAFHQHFQARTTRGFLTGPDLAHKPMYSLIVWITLTRSLRVAKFKDWKGDYCPMRGDLASSHFKASQSAKGKFSSMIEFHNTPKAFEAYIKRLPTEEEGIIARIEEAKLHSAVKNLVNPQNHVFAPLLNYTESKCLDRYQNVEIHIRGHYLLSTVPFRSPEYFVCHEEKPDKGTKLTIVGARVKSELTPDKIRFLMINQLESLTNDDNSRNCEHPQLHEQNVFRMTVHDTFEHVGACHRGSGHKMYVYPRKHNKCKKNDYIEFEMKK